MQNLLGSALLLSLLCLVGCGTEQATEEPKSPAPSTEVLPDPSEPPRNEVVVVFLGDSLTAGFGLDEDQAFPALVEKSLRDQDYGVRVINGGVSGDTTAGGLGRLPWLLRQDPDLVVVALGGNDGLRGLDLDSSEENLRNILEQGEAAGAKVVLAGMLIPPNYGADYADSFAAIFPRLASEMDVPLIPFLLHGVAGDAELNQADGIHPTAQGQEIVAATVFEHIKPIIDEIEAIQAAEADTDVKP